MKAHIHGYGFLFYWICDCGKSGKPTTNGRANAARDSHLRSHREADRGRHLHGSPSPQKETEE